MHPRFDPVRFYRSLIAQGQPRDEAARTVDYALAERAARRRLARRGVRREPTAREVAAIWEAM